jgi:periplasmic protein CpxP/Spy
MTKSPFNRHLKPLLFAALLAAAGASFAQATPPASTDAPHAHRGTERGHRGDPSRMEAHMQRRLGEFKQQLKIEPAQESAWAAWTSAMKPPADLRQRGQQIRAEMDKLSTPERIDHMKALRAERDAQMDKRAQATKDFYAQLNPEQKKSFDSHRGMRGGHGGGHRGQGMMGHMHGQAGGEQAPGHQHG